MLQKQQIISQIKSNIKQFNQLDFCNAGGWPNFDSLDILIYSQSETDKGSIVKLSILYSCEHSASCACFKTTSTPDSIRKEIFIGEEGGFEVLM